MKKILEYIWLAISVGSLISAAHAFKQNNLSQDSIIFASIFLISFFMYLFRKKQRKQNS